MKTAKRLLTAALAVLFTFMCALPAMADDLVNQETYTLTIDNPEAGHTYEAYQIFEGTFSVGTGKNAQGNPVNESYLSDINWGTGVVHEGETGYDVMIKALKEATPTLYDDGETLVAGVNDATKVAVCPEQPQQCRDRRHFQRNRRRPPDGCFCNGNCYGRWQDGL